MNFSVKKNDIGKVKSSIRMVAPTFNRQTGTMRSEALLDNDLYQIPGGMRGDIELLD